MGIGIEGSCWKNIEDESIAQKEIGGIISEGNMESYH